AEGSVHYLSVNSSEQGAGSNYKNDGAKAKDSIVLGVRSSSEGINGVVVGNDNKLTGTKNDQNNSVVIGTGLNVDGVHNIVVGTNYENYDQKETKVKGAHNTVIGNGNLVGYTAVKDPDDATKWKYTEVSTSGSDVNVVVGSCNTANGSSVAVGTSLEVENLGRAFGSGNKVIGSDNGGGQWGLALGSNNTVKGEMAVSVGTGTNASGDYTVSIGSEAKTNATNSIAMGYKAETVEGWSAAIGSEAQTTGTASTAVGGLSASATVDYGAAFGSYSVAQRASGVAGYLANGQTGSAWISSLGAFSVGDDVNGYSRQITGVAAGSEDTDAVNVAQLKALEKKLTKGGSNVEVQGDENTGIVVEKNPKENKPNPSTGGTTPSTGGTTPSTGGTTTTPAAENKTVYKVKLDKKIDVGHISIDGTENKENAVVGDVKINGEKGHGTVTGLSNTTWDEKHVVSGRAATEDQLQAVSQKNRQAISELGTQLERGTASAAALAALHPLEFDPADKWDFAVGYSNYRSANTFAFGGFYRPNERTLVSLGGTFGGENIVNVGLSFKTGKGSDGISTSRVAMAREIQALKLQNKQQEEKSQQLKQDNQAIRKENQEMKKEVEWLKRQVAKLLTK
ncbi:YadA-like family protein, partial [Megasphaera hutchinsoni]